MRTLGQQARDFRAGKEWNSAQMGEAVGTSRQNIESLEKHGNRIPKYIGALARLMGRTVDDMLCEAGLAEPLPPVAPWPFAIPYARYEALSLKDKGKVEGKLEEAIERCEQNPSVDEVNPLSRATDSADLAAQARRHLGRGQPQPGKGRARLP